jgi:hypothetical protein
LVFFRGRIFNGFSRDEFGWFFQVFGFLRIWFGFQDSVWFFLRVGFSGFSKVWSVFLGLDRFGFSGSVLVFLGIGWFFWIVAHQQNKDIQRCKAAQEQIHLIYIGNI